MKCPKCGASNPEWALFCEECGHQLSEVKPKDLQKTIDISKKEIDFSPKKDRFTFDDSSDEEIIEEVKPSRVKHAKEAETITEEALDEEKVSFGKKIFDVFFEEVEVDEDGNEVVINNKPKKEKQSIVREEKEPVVQEEKPKVEKVHDDSINLRPMGPSKEEVVTRKQVQEARRKELKGKSNLNFKKVGMVILAIIIVIALVFTATRLLSNRSSSSTSSSNTTSNSNNSSNSSSSNKTTSKYTGLSVSSVEATSTLEESGYDHSAKNIVDGDVKTAWNEGASGYGFKEAVTVTLKNQQEVKSMTIYNGYCKDEETYNNNNRIQQLIVYFDDGENQRITLEDVYNKAQTITFKNSHTTKTIKVEIRTVYRGSKYNDTCISELSFN